MGVGVLGSLRGEWLGGFPAGSPLSGELFNEGLVLGSIGKVLVFLRIGLVIVELNRLNFGVIVAMNPRGETITVRPHGVAH